MRQSVEKMEQLDVQVGARELAESSTIEEAPRMLIADDDPSIVSLLADRCSRMGFVVDTATNGLQALLKARQGKLYTLVIDINMPEIDGLSVCARLLEPDRTPANVIVITGSKDDPDTLDRCEGFGAYYARKGPNFWIDLEAALAEIHPRMAGRIGKLNRSSAAPEVRLRPCVLLIDDDDDVRLFLSSRLKKCGLDVRYASDAQQGFRMACREEPAVIITDYYMPNGDAQYLLTRLRSLAATKNIPVIVLSGRELGDVREQNLRREIFGRPGAAQILKKSQDTGALFHTLKQFCSFEPDLRRSVHMG